MAAHRWSLHPTHPQRRVIDQVVARLLDDGVVASPTDACYSLICKLDNKGAEARMRAIRHLDQAHSFSLFCRDVGDAALYAKIDNAAFRLMKKLTPGPFTFILPATRETPRRLQDPKRRMVGIRIADQPFIRGLSEALGEPLLGTTLVDEVSGLPFAEPDDIVARLGHAIDGVADAGAIGIETTTVLDLSQSLPQLIRQGCGDASGVVDLA